MAVPSPTVVALRALSYCPSLEGSWPLFSTTVEAPPSCARLVSMRAFAAPSAGQATETDAWRGKSVAATDSPTR